MQRGQAIAPFQGKFNPTIQRGFQFNKHGSFGFSEHYQPFETWNFCRIAFAFAKILYFGKFQCTLAVLFQFSHALILAD